MACLTASRRVNKASNNLLCLQCYPFKIDSTSEPTSLSTQDTVCPRAAMLSSPHLAHSHGCLYFVSRVLSIYSMGRNNAQSKGTRIQRSLFNRIPFGFEPAKVDLQLLDLLMPVDSCGQIYLVRSLRWSTGREGEAHRFSKIRLSFEVSTKSGQRTDHKRINWQVFSVLALKTVQLSLAASDQCVSSSQFVTLSRQR